MIFVFIDVISQRSNSKVSITMIKEQDKNINDSMKMFDSEDLFSDILDSNVAVETSNFCLK